MYSQIFGAGIDGPKLDQTFKMLQIWQKLTEIQKLLESYGSRVISRFEGEGDWRRGMLQEIAPHVSGEKQRLIECLVRAMDLKEPARTNPG